jgi:hypothetical protein
LALLLKNKELKKSLSVAAVDNLKRKYEFTADWNKADALG